MGQIRFIDEIISGRIESIRSSLQESIHSIQIINWLKNFEDEEWDSALTVLENLKYYSTNQVIYEFDEGLKRILKASPVDKTIFLVGLGDYGKSGSSLIYFIKKTPTFCSNEKRFKVLRHVTKLKQQNVNNDAVLVLVDDIVGSGKSLDTYYSHNIKHQILKDKIQIKIVVLCVAYMRDSVAYLKGKIQEIEIFGTEYLRAFNSGSSCFGYRPKMLPIREICYKYGINLCFQYDANTKENVPQPLGFNNSQSLIVFSHSSPNNTLPIIWSNKNGWYPLYPRGGGEKISRYKNFRDETLHWLSIGYRLNFFKKKPNKSNIYFKDTNYKLLAVIRLIKRESIHPIICQKIGLSINELNELLQVGIQKGLLAKDHKLTAEGHRIYNEIRKKFRITRSEKELVVNQTQIQYVPKTFLGKA